MRNVPVVRVHGPKYPMAQPITRVITKAVGQNVKQVCFENLTEGQKSILEMNSGDIANISYIPLSPKD